MKTSFAFLAFGMAIFLYIWSAISCHALHWFNDKTIILSAAVVALFFLVIGFSSLLFA